MRLLEQESLVSTSVDPDKSRGKLEKESLSLPIALDRLGAILVQFSLEGRVSSALELPGF